MYIINWMSYLLKAALKSSLYEKNSYSTTLIASLLFIFVGSAVGIFCLLVSLLFTKVSNCFHIERKPWGQAEDPWRAWKELASFAALGSSLPP